MQSEGMGNIVNSSGTINRQQKEADDKKCVAADEEIEKVCIKTKQTKYQLQTNGP